MLSIIATSCLLMLNTNARAEDWPARPITMVNPFAAGGPNDVLARLFAQRMGELLGQPVVLENVGGAGGMNGADRVAKSAPDGYTFLLGTVGTQAQNQTLFKKPRYNSTTDFEPVALIVEAPLVLVARKDFPTKDMKEFVAYTKANESKMQFGSAGTGSAIHLGCVLMNSVTGLNVVHVPYRGANPAMQDLISGRIDYLCDIVTTAKSQIDVGSVQPIAILTKERSSVLPNVPTAIEQGFAVEAYTWNAFFLPKGTPRTIIEKLNKATVDTMKTPEVREKLESAGLRFVSDDRTTPEYLAKFVTSEIEKWAAPIKSSGITVD
ncbi:MAG: tripartite tricarboxylate transporter substrate-binding protein [Afipia sp.]|nr:tripartite tricarboxylate transporter substrate-binding protein [Afipia sp.]